MADIVADLLEFGLTPHEISRRLGMDDEEVDRLADRGDMPKRDTVTGFRTVESFEHSDPAIARLVRVGYSTVES